VLRAIAAEKSVGRAMASSRALVCRLWVCPWVDAIASMQVRTTLLKTSCAVSDQPEVWLWVRSESDLGLVAPWSLTRRAHSRRAARILATSMKKFIPIAQKNDSRGANSVDVEPHGLAGPDVLHPVGQRVRELEVLRRPGLLHVVAGDRDRVEPRHPGAAEGEDVADDPHRRLGRVDVGVADHELLEDVVLDGPGELLGRHPLLLRRDDEEREARGCTAPFIVIDTDIWSSGMRSNSGAHVVDRVDRDPGHADVAGHPRVVGVVAAVGGQVEGDRQALLPARGCAGRTRWTPRRSRSPRTADGPRLGRVHRRVGPRRYGGAPGHGVEEVQARRGRPRCRAA
jgi:hypothetical protein